ncbi:MULTISPECIES: nitroreductase family protein [Clostridium]|uniref:Nitroreductase family protein n=1 Tax=Clostridium cibarium TaxID=2762247 RepID=A0ABR8PX95_9CLOT|nr:MULTISPECIES: nitroreductase family protein [Clostridium]MBD7912801.1 nitroreductase family protein [Clostridium cibarium]
MDTIKTILSRRTVRKFKQDKIERKTLESLINGARLAPSGGNLQPLKYIIVDKEEEVKKIYENVAWAKYLGENFKQNEDERPTAFIAVLVDTDIKKNGYEIDLGAAVENILLGAYSEGIGTCWMGAINKKEISKILRIPDRFLLNTVIALGYKGEFPTTVDTEDSIIYYKGEDGELCVPKRKLEDIILEF